MINRFEGDSRIGVGGIFKGILFGMILYSVNGELIRMFGFDRRNKGTEIQIIVDGRYFKVLRQVGILLKMLRFNPLMMIVHGNGMFRHAFVDIGWSI